MKGLCVHSADWRESGAIWAGHISGDVWRATDVFFHHELGEALGGPLFLELSESAKYRLYELLNRKGLRLIGLIHTHPEEWVGMSEVDEQNQIGSRIGFWSLVAPWYGRKPWALSKMGVHERLEKGWRRLEQAELLERIRIVRR